MEYVPGGNLKDYLLNSRATSKDTYANLAPFSATLTPKDLLTFAYQIAKGMSYLEQIKVTACSVLFVDVHFRGCVWSHKNSYKTRTLRVFRVSLTCNLACSFLYSCQ